MLYEVITVKGGKIVKAQWNGISNIAGATDKKSWAASGKYGMAKAAKQGEWDKQAAVITSYSIHYTKLYEKSRP